jgi:hypothetical protein
VLSITAPRLREPYLASVEVSKPSRQRIILRGDTHMSSKAKPALQTEQIRQLVASELDAVAGGAATNPKEGPPGPCFPLPPRPKPQIM